jgi:hypothetical protein
MKRIGTLVGLVVLCGAFAVRADEPKKMEKKGEHKEHMAKAAGAATTLTGCLQKGDEPNTFLLTNATGGPAGADKWELVGAAASLKMADHVGHKVTVSGHSVSAASAEKIEEKGEKKMTAAEKKAEKKEEKKEEAGEHHLKVSSLKHVSPTCP